VQPFHNRAENGAIRDNRVLRLSSRKLALRDAAQQEMERDSRMLRGLEHRNPSQFRGAPIEMGNSVTGGESAAEVASIEAASIQSGPPVSHAWGSAASVGDNGADEIPMDSTGRFEYDALLGGANIETEALERSKGARPKGGRRKSQEHSMLASQSVVAPSSQFLRAFPPRSRFNPCPGTKA